MLHLVLALLLQGDPDAAAAELLKKVEEKVLAAKTLHVEFEAMPAAGAERGDQVKGEIRIGENGAFAVSITIKRRRGRVEDHTLKSDGRMVVGSSPRPLPNMSSWKPASIQKFLRRTCAQANMLAVYPIYSRSVTPDEFYAELEPTDIKAEGKEKIGSIEATRVSFTLNPKDGPRRGFTIQQWIDPATLNILKRYIQTDSPANETTARFDFDPVFPADFFEIQTEAMLREGREVQLARAVSLHARYTGRLPKTLEDLKRRPADLPAEVFWPESGFWIGGAIPKDVAYAVTDKNYTVGAIKEPIPDISPIGAPNDRLKKFFTAKVMMHLLSGAAHGYAKAHAMHPRQPQDLLRKPDYARFWPDGGWVAGPALPVDPWGDPYSIRTGAAFSVTIAKPKGRLLRFQEVTPEERRALDEVALPPLPEREHADVESHFQKLGSEKLADREEATRALIAKGGGVIRLISARLAKEKDPEVISRLGTVMDHFRSLKRMWVSEMKGLRFSLSGTGGDLAMIPNNERVGMISLKTFTTAQADFRSNDRDGNRTLDFYVQDVAGLYALVGATGKETEAKPGREGDPVLKLIELDAARADASEDRWEYPILGLADPEPRSGYFFAVLKNFERGGVAVPYHGGNGRNGDQYAFVAYPAEYGVTGRHTYIVNENNEIWSRDLNGEEIDTFPAGPGAAGWVKMD